MWRVSTWTVNTYERVRCWILGHVWFDDPRFSWVWCTECGTRFKRPPRDPLLGEFYD